MLEPSDLATQVAEYELSLRRRAGAHAAEAGDPSLANLHRAIGARRQRRSPGGGTFAGRLSALVAVPPAIDTAEHADAGVATGAADEREGAIATAPEQATTDRQASAPAGRIASIDQHGRTVKIFRIGRPSGFSFRPGQYLKLGVPGGKREDFSIASPPHEPVLELAVELREGGKVTPALFALGVGAAVDIGDGAKGCLRLDSSAVHHLMVATVTGIAPLRSMVLDALHRGTADQFTILHGASYASELAFHDELVALASQHDRVRYLPTVSRPTEPTNRSWTGPTGRVDPLASVVASALDPRTTHVYAVGNGGMIKNVQRDLGSAGFGISTESYGG